MNKHDKTERDTDCSDVSSYGPRDRYRIGFGDGNDLGAVQQLASLLSKKDELTDILSRQKRLAADRLRVMPKKTDAEKAEFKKLQVKSTSFLRSAGEDVARQLKTVDAEIEDLQKYLEERKRKSSDDLAQLALYKKDIDRRAASTVSSVSGSNAAGDYQPRTDSDMFSKAMDESRREIGSTSGVKLEKSVHSARKSPFKGVRKGEGNRKRVEPPTQLAGPTKKTRVKKSAEALRNERIDREAKNVKIVITDWQIQNGQLLLMGPDPPSDPQPVQGGIVPHDMPQERELELSLRPDRLRNVAFASQPGTEETKEDEILRRLRNISSVLTLHSLAFSNVLKMVRVNRDLLASDSPLSAEIEEHLTKSTQAILLASDSDLSSLPFQTTDEIAAFLMNPERVEKLAMFILTYFAYNKQYITDVNNLLMHPKLQAQVYFHGQRPKNGEEKFVPRSFQLFYVRVARAAHDIHHWGTNKTFNEADFLEDARQSLYNTPRNERKRNFAMKAIPKLKKKVAAKTATNSSLSVYDTMADIVKRPHWKGDATAALKKVALANAGFEDHVADYDLAIDFLETVKAAPLPDDVEEYMEAKKSELKKIPFPT